MSIDKFTIAYKNFPDRLKKLQVDLNLSQTDLSKMINISRPALSEYIRGKKIPSITVVIKIALATGISLNWLLLGEGEMLLSKEQKNLFISPNDQPKEKIKRWIDYFWENATSEERIWFKIEMKKRFPELAEWQKKNH